MKKELISVRGFFRLRIGEGKDGKKIIGDSGWRKNEVVNLGFSQYICGALGGIAGSKQISNIQLGTGTAPNATHSVLDGSTKGGTALMSIIASKTLQGTVAFASGAHPGGTPTLRNIALANTSSGATICCGATYATSVWNSNQGISATYQLRFGTA